MRPGIALITLLLVTGAALADPTGVRHAVDLRDSAALQQLERANPAHYAKIRQILAELTAHPERVESDWLQASFAAHDVELSQLLLKTSNPPRQLLRFTLDDTRYTLHVVRSDLVAKPAVLH